jgi:hypothetical protein
MNSLEYNNGNEECTLRKRLTNLTRVRQQETLLTSVYLRTFIFLFSNNDYIYREGGGGCFSSKAKNLGHAAQKEEEGTHAASMSSFSCRTLKNRPNVIWRIFVRYKMRQNKIVSVMSNRREFSLQ